MTEEVDEWPVVGEVISLPPEVLVVIQMMETERRKEKAQQKMLYQQALERQRQIAT